VAQLLGRSALKMQVLRAFPFTAAAAAAADGLTTCAAAALVADITFEHMFSYCCTCLVRHELLRYAVYGCVTYLQQILVAV